MIRKRSGKRVIDAALMSFFVYCESVPEGVLPAAVKSVVIADGAMPVNALQIISTGIGHHGPGATTPSGTSSTADTRFIIEVGSGIEDDAGEVLG